MTTDTLFTIASPPDAAMITIRFDGAPYRVPAGISVAAALLAAGVGNFRESAVGHAPRAPYCMMGVCFECLVEIDGDPSRQSCLIPVREGMDIRRQLGATGLDFVNEGDAA